MLIIATGAFVGILTFVIWGYKYFEQQEWFELLHLDKGDYQHLSLYNKKEGKTILDLGIDIPEKVLNARGYYHKTKVELDEEKLCKLKDYYRKNCIAEKVFDKELNIVTSSYYSANMATLEDVFNILGVESIIEDVRNEVSQHEYKQILDENGYAKYVKVVEQYEEKTFLDGVNNRCFVDYRHEL